MVDVICLREKLLFQVTSLALINTADQRLSSVRCVFVCVEHLAKRSSGSLIGYAHDYLPIGYTIRLWKSSFPCLHHIH